MATIINVPNDVLFSVFSWLGPQDLASSFQVCNSWAHAFYTPKRILFKGLVLDRCKKLLKAGPAFSGVDPDSLIVEPLNRSVIPSGLRNTNNIYQETDQEQTLKNLYQAVTKYWPSEIDMHYVEQYGRNITVSQNSHGAMLQVQYEGRLGGDRAIRANFPFPRTISNCRLNYGYRVFNLEDLIGDVSEEEYVFTDDSDDSDIDMDNYNPVYVSNPGTNSNRGNVSTAASSSASTSTSILFPPVRSARRRPDSSSSSSSSSRPDGSNSTSSDTIARTVPRTAPTVQTAPDASVSTGVSVLEGLNFNDIFGEDSDADVNRDDYETGDQDLEYDVDTEQSVDYDSDDDSDDDSDGDSEDLLMCEESLLPQDSPASASSMNVESSNASYSVNSDTSFNVNRASSVSNGTRSRAYINSSTSSSSSSSATFSTSSSSSASSGGFSTNFVSRTSSNVGGRSNGRTADTIRHSNPEAASEELPGGDIRYPNRVRVFTYARDYLERRAMGRRNRPTEDRSKMFKPFTTIQVHEQSKDVGMTDGKSDETCKYNLSVGYRSVAYYEVAITDLSGKNSDEHDEQCISIGLCNEQFPLNSKQAGWDMNSYGWHSDDGCLFHGVSAQGGYYYEAIKAIHTSATEPRLRYEARNRVKVSRFGPGDVVGCGIDYLWSQDNGKAAIFYTKNGDYLGNAFTDVSGTYYPCVGIDSTHAMEFNFGAKPFVYDLENYHNHLKSHAEKVAKWGNS